MAVNPPMTPTILTGYSSVGGSIIHDNSGGLGIVVANMWCNLVTLELETDNQTPFDGEPAEFAYAKTVFNGTATRGGASIDTLRIQTAYPWDGPAGNRILVEGNAEGTGAGEIYYWNNISSTWDHSVVDDAVITDGFARLSGLSMFSYGDLEAPVNFDTQAADVRNGDLSGTTPLKFVAEANVNYPSPTWYNPARTNQPYDLTTPPTTETPYDYLDTSIGDAVIAFADWDVSGVPLTDVYPNASPAIIVNTSGYVRFRITT